MTKVQALLLLLQVLATGASQHCRVTQICVACTGPEKRSLPEACDSTGHREEVSCPNPPSTNEVVYLRPCVARRNGFDDQLDDFALAFKTVMREISIFVGWERQLEDGGLESAMEERSIDLHVEGGRSGSKAAAAAAGTVGPDGALVSDASRGTTDVLRFEIGVLAILAVASCCVANARKAAMRKRTRGQSGGPRYHSVRRSGRGASVLPTASTCVVSSCGGVMRLRWLVCMLTLPPHMSRTPHNTVRASRHLLSRPPRARRRFRLDLQCTRAAAAAGAAAAARRALGRRFTSPPQFFSSLYFICHFLFDGGHLQYTLGYIAQ